MAGLTTADRKVIKDKAAKMWPGVVAKLGHRKLHEVASGTGMVHTSLGLLNVTVHGQSFTKREDTGDGAFARGKTSL